jgi:hypothetical protein
MKTKIDLRELKEKHRLELVIVETGEKLEANANIWRGLDTPGLIVDLNRQTWRIEHAGVEKAGGDVFDWLKFRYSWNFGMCLRYLNKRPADAPRNSEEKQHVPDEGKKNHGHLVTVSRLEPQDPMQTKALKLGGDEIRRFFSPHYSSFEILEYMSCWPARFLPLIDAQVDTCESCGKEFDWEDPDQRCYLQQFYDYGGEEMDSEDQKLFFLDNRNLSGFVCGDCARERIKQYLAMQLCFQSARLRERSKDEEREKEVRRLEKIARASAEPLTSGGDEFDYLYVLNRLVDFDALIDIEATEEEIRRTFANKNFYIYLQRDKSLPSTEFWARAVAKYSA